MKVSQTVLEWQAEARAMARVESQAELILRLLALRFPPGVPQEVTAAVNAMRDLETLKVWFDAAVTAVSQDDFRRAIRNSDQTSPPTDNAR
jgi:hypothetical protein